MERVKDSVEVVMELDEREVYSHIAHESAEDLIRIISSIDAERAKLRGEIIYYHDDWDELIRERVAKGKRHTAFDFYNPFLLDIWEAKVNEIKRTKRLEKAWYVLLGSAVAVTALLSVKTRVPYILIGLALTPLALRAREYTYSRLDLIYYELAQFFIDELRSITTKHSLKADRYRFKIFSRDYFGVKIKQIGTGLFAVVQTGKSGDNR
ncbi:hypothetical protein E3E36_06410 [Thermococcus sp. M36]|uniref:hypothetical protein n=1 Tax=Thermococcus sp. M36 TaxID=1638261 RepID=UPI00143B004A|nr:hypothetical protein [Thermococcus sp. M36]NJE05781.1 hypothetical protein [Thermococcus sp. M36]